MNPYGGDMVALRIESAQARKARALPRWRKIAAMRDAGAKFREIGARFGITTQRAHTIYMKHKTT